VYKKLIFLFIVLVLVTIMLCGHPNGMLYSSTANVDSKDILTTFNATALSSSNFIGEKSNKNYTLLGDNNSTSITYSNATYGIAITYPPGWTVTEGKTATIFHNQSKNLNVVAEIMAPIQSSYYNSKIGASHNSLRLIVENYSTFGDYTKENIQKYLGDKDANEETENKLLTIANKRIGAIGLYCHNFDLKSWNQNFTLAGYPAHQILLDYSYDKYSKDATEVWTIKGDKIYIIEFVAQDKYYEVYIPTVKRMIESFQIL